MIAAAFYLGGIAPTFFMRYAERRDLGEDWAVPRAFAEAALWPAIVACCVFGWRGW